MTTRVPLTIDESRKRLLDEIAGANDVVFIRGHGNVGDDLIHAGARQLLAAVDYREESVLRLDGVSGELALLSGSGAWCHAFHAMPQYLRQVEEAFERVIVLPSSFDVTAEGVEATLRQARAKVFAREESSYEQIRDLCDADLAHDTALYFDYRPYRRPGRGVLLAYRDDPEAATARVPDGNDDISMTCETLDQWLLTLARHSAVKTDRAHVMIGAALLGKTVEYASSNYHKVPGIARFSLSSFPVVPSPEPSPAEVQRGVESSRATGFRTRRESDRQAHLEWLADVRTARAKLQEVVGEGETAILLDEAQWGREFFMEGRALLPFPERAGEYAGPPADDAAAIGELERLRSRGAAFLAVAWTARWWFDHYAGFRRHLDATAERILDDASLVVYDLRSSPPNTADVSGG